MAMEVREKLNENRARVLDYLAKQNGPVSIVEVNQEIISYGNLGVEWVSTDRTVEYLKSKGLAKDTGNGTVISKKGLKVHKMLEEVSSEIERKE